MADLPDHDIYFDLFGKPTGKSGEKGPDYKAVGVDEHIQARIAF